MHVTRVIGVLEPGGAQLSLLRLARAQTALGVHTRLVVGDATRAGLDLARSYGLEPEVYAAHESLTVSPRQWCPDPGFARWLRTSLRDCDLVHAHMVGAWWAAAQAVPRGVPLVASEHNSLSWPLGDHTEAAREAAPRVAAFFAHGPEALAFAQLVGVPPERREPGRSAVTLQARPRPGLETPRITFTGRFRADKGPDLLLRALAHMPSPPRTYLVGEGPMWGELRTLVDELGLARVVHMPGWSNEPARYVAGAAVHVVPSRQEAWSQSAVVALGLGVPVVATAVEGLPVTLAEGRGLLVPPEDPAALAAALTGVIQGTLGTDRGAGRSYAARFDAARIAGDYFTVYQAVLAGTATRAAPAVSI